MHMFIKRPFPLIFLSRAKSEPACQSWGDQDLEPANSLSLKGHAKAGNENTGKVPSSYFQKQSRSGNNRADLEMEGSCASR